MNILLTSVGRRSYLVQYFKEALNGQGEVHVANSSDLSPAFPLADYAVVTPLIYDKNYIPFLLEYCEEKQIKAIISLFDIDLPILSKHKEKFAEIGTKVIISDLSIIEICNDKWKTYQFLIRNGFNSPLTFIDLQQAIDSLTGGIIKFPVIVKPRWGMGSIAVFEADNIDELELLYKKTQRNIMKTYLKYESMMEIEKSVLIQTKINGQEYGMDVINDLNGNYQTTIAKKKYSMRSGETDCAIIVDNSDLKVVGERLSKVLHHIGNLDVDVFVDGDKIIVLELNARFGGGYPFSHLAGVNLPGAIIKWLKNDVIEPELLNARIGVVGQKDIRVIELKTER